MSKLWFTARQEVILEQTRSNAQLPFFFFFFCVIAGAKVSEPRPITDRSEGKEGIVMGYLEVVDWQPGHGLSTSFGCDWDSNCRVSRTFPAWQTRLIHEASVCKPSPLRYSWRGLVQMQAANRK